MNALVRKEIRLVLPAWIVAMLLAMVQAVTRPYDFYIASLLFFGLTIMSLSTIGRETSLNTFSSLLALPAERLRVWKIKLAVLSAAFLSVFGVWVLAFLISLWNSVLGDDGRTDSYNLFIAVCLIATAAFTGGLWTTLLLRQLAGAFWLTLLLPVVLSSLAGGILAGSESSNLVIAVLSVVIAVYSVAGFLFSRWLFFRAQDVGWSGGTINLPEWNFGSGTSVANRSARRQKPIVALFKKEVLLHQASLTGAVGLAVLHLGIIALRGVHKFPRESAGEILTSIFWMLWLIMPVIVGGLAMAEERKLGLMEGLLCLPVSRRVQFALKTFVTLCLGVFLGGVMPVLLETLGMSLGALNPMFMSDHTHLNNAGAFSLSMFLLGLMLLCAWLGLVSYFASSLTRNFLQAVGIGLVTFVFLSMVIPFGSGIFFFRMQIPAHSILLMIIAAPTIVITLFWQAYLNFKDFREGWLIWRRALLGVIGAVLFILISSSFIYNRGWEYFKPMEPPHGPARLSLANPPVFENETYDNLLVRLPDGRVWFDYLSRYDFDQNRSLGKLAWGGLVKQLPVSVGPQKYLSGSNWVSATARYIDETYEKRGSKEYVHVFGYADSVGVQTDGTLWVSDKPDQNSWTAGHVTRFGRETDWQQVVPSYSVTMVFLLKKDGTLWRWGTNRLGRLQWPQQWPGLRTFQPQQVGTDSDWAVLYPDNRAQKHDGSVWNIWQDPPKPETNFDRIPLAKLSHQMGWDSGAYVRDDGSLWVYATLQSHGQDRFATYQSGRETNWVAVAHNWEWMVALKSDGTLWKWDHLPNQSADFSKPPTKMGIHNDWVAITGTDGGVVTLAADGSLWFWPNRNSYEYQQILLRLPKQPKFLGNIFNQAH